MILRRIAVLSHAFISLSLIVGSVSIADDESLETDPSEVSVSDVESAIVRRTNEFRKDHELSALSREPSLADAAKRFAQYMARTEKYGHRADGRTPAKRAKAAGYEYCVVRENIAYRTNTGEVSADSLTDVFVEGWIDSPTHRENMLAEHVTQTGVGVATDGGVTYYAVQLFGRPKSASIQLKITNRSDKTHTVVIETDAGQDEFDLQPRMYVTTRRCYMTTVRLADQDEGIEMRSGGELLVEEEGLTLVDDAKR